MANKASWHNVGQKIRHLRKEHQLTIKQLAAGCNLSSNAISLIERGEVAPTVATLCKIATALGAPISYFFQEICPNEVILTRAQEHACGHLTEYKQPTDQIFTILANAIFPQDNLPAANITHLAHTESTVQDVGDNQEPSPVYSPEFVLCLSGQIQYEANGQSFQLEPGDSLSFNGNFLHCWRNQGSGTAIAVMVLHSETAPELELGPNQ